MGLRHFSSLSSIGIGEDNDNVNNNKFYRNNDENPLIISRGGAVKLFQPNTMQAIQQAIDEGADGVLLNIRLSKDNKIFCYMNETTELLDNNNNNNNNTEDNELISDMTWNQICKYKLAKKLPYERYDELIKYECNETIPLLSDVFNKFGATIVYHLVLMSESENDLLMKKRAYWGKLLGQLINEYNLSDYCVVTCFNLLALQELHRISPSIPIGFNYNWDNTLVLDEATQEWFEDPDTSSLHKFERLDVSNGEGFVEWLLQHHSIICEHRPSCQNMKLTVCLEKSQLEVEQIKELQDNGFAVGCDNIYGVDERTYRSDALLLRKCIKNKIDWITSTSVEFVKLKWPEMSTSKSASKSKSN